MLPLIPTLILVLVIAGIVWQRKANGRIDRLEREIKVLQARVTALSAGQVPLPMPVGETALTAVEDETPAPAEPQEAAMSAVAAAEEPVVGETLAETTPAATVAPPPAAPRPKEKESMESWLGARWAVWVGGLALALGGVFLVRYSIESGLLGPEMRLSLAALFGLVLMAAGEVVRRRAMPQLSDRFGNAMIPGALTAAGAVTLMGAIFAAYAVYGFIGATPAFLALALVSFATIALSLLHGQALAGLGLLASLVTPALVASDNPSANALFGFLALAWVAVAAASRARQWTVVPTLANIGLGLWALAYVATADEGFDPTPATLALLVMISGATYVWPGRWSRFVGPQKPGISMLLGRAPLQITLSLSLMVVLPALMLLVRQADEGILVVYAAVALIAALAAFGAARAYAVWPALAGATAAILAILITAATWLSGAPLAGDGQPAVFALTGEVGVYLTLGAAFTLFGMLFLRRFRASEADFSKVWAFLMPAVPVTIAFISFFNFGNLGRDWTHGLYGLALGIVLLAAADWLFRKSDDAANGKIDWPANLLVAGSFAAFTLSLHALTNGITTTILMAVIGFLYVLAMRLKPWPALPWMMAAAILIVFGRIAWEPTVIGHSSLGTTPFFNALLPGYGIPALLAIVTAFLLRRSDDFRIRNIMQALASLSAMMTIAVLVRHAMNGGTLDAGVPTLGEQSIYTLLTIGFSGVLMTLDLKSPSPVFRIGSMIAGVIATVNVLSLHVFALNPYFTGEGTGPWPLVNLLLIGYLLPALAYGLVAWLARDRRPMPYVAMLAVSGGVLGFLWATLSVRRFWQGENIADWKGFLAGETYSYSVVWLLIGVVLLVLGSRFDLRSLRLASAGLVLLAVLKVFLIDMSNLEGILRALSFMGLGAVLIGIGLFYQRILVRKDGLARKDGLSNSEPADTGNHSEGPVS